MFSKFALLGKVPEVDGRTVKRSTTRANITTNP
jgi:hypothetical protein